MKWSWSIVMTKAMEHCDDRVMEHCDERAMGIVMTMR